MIGKSFTISGMLIVSWILSLYGIIIGIWWLRLEDYFIARGLAAGISKGNRRVAAIALTGHFADVTMGMVLLPVARNSALSSFFRLSASTTFAFHMIQAYVLFALVLIHGLMYASWVAVFNEDQSLYRFVFPVLNPTYFYHEVWPGGRGPLEIWRASIIFTGLTASLIMIAMFLTTFPEIRRKHFNLFYFTHLLSIVAVIVVCLHASTMFYCTAPGLAMWVLDWGMRIYELSGRMDSSIKAIGNGWFCLSLPLPRRRLDGCACYSPLAHFHIHHTGSSIRELHPFTTITHLASQKVETPSSTSEKVLANPSANEMVQIQFLFRRSKATTPLTPNTTAHPREERSSKQWTDKLASLVEEEPRALPLTHPKDGTEDPEPQPPHRLPSLHQTFLRLEGPYFTAAHPSAYNTVICLVAGTGISGAIAIAAAFGAQDALKHENSTAVADAFALPSPRYEPAVDPMESIRTSSQDGKAVADEGAGAAACAIPKPGGRTWKRCIIHWSVREIEYIALPFFHEAERPGLEVRPHLTGKGRPRLDMEGAIRDLGEQGGKTWVYLSGPNAFIEAGERACRECGVEYYGARWN